MKRSTVNFSMRRTTKITTLMLIITVAVGLLPLVSTTVEASFYDYEYILYRGDTGRIYVAKAPFHLLANYSNASRATSLGIVDSTSDIYQLYYNYDLKSWVVSVDQIATFPENSRDPKYIVGDDTIYYDWAYIFSSTQPTFASNMEIITNSEWNSTEIGLVKSYSNDLSGLPRGLTKNDVQQIITESINTSTESGQAAQTIINNTTIQYNSYQAGDISSAAMQQNVTDNIDALNDLTPSTLLDAMQINNGLTYNQTIQDQLLNTASGNVQSMINGYQNTINNAITNYQNGTTSQQDTVNIINQAITNLNNMIINGTANTTADVNAVNAAINAANANLDSVTGYKDLSQEVSDKVQHSDQAEIDYLDDITAETTATVEEIAPSQNFTSGQTSEAGEVLDLIWENEFVKRLLPMCAGFMVVCVVLGIKYKV